MIKISFESGKKYKKTMDYKTATLVKSDKKLYNPIMDPDNFGSEQMSNTETGPLTVEEVKALKKFIKSVDMPNKPTEEQEYILDRIGFFTLASLICSVPWVIFAGFAFTGEGLAIVQFVAASIVLFILVLIRNFYKEKMTEAGITKEIKDCYNKQCAARSRATRNNGFQDENDIFYDPTYSSLPCNIYNRD